jgi:hypothetical protein
MLYMALVIAMAAIVFLSIGPLLWMHDKKSNAAAPVRVKRRRRH